MSTAGTQYQDLLHHEFEVRKNSNPAYSLRAFARDLDISVSNLSRIFSGKQDLSLRKAEQIAKTLGLSPQESEYFYTLLQSKYLRSEKTKIAVEQKLHTPEMRGADLAFEYFKTIADWHYFAILELTGVEGFKADPSWIAHRLGISESLASESLVRLQKLELLEQNENGVWQKSYEFRASPSGIPGRAIKTHHHQILKKAETALLEDQTDDCDFSSDTFSMPESELEWAKGEILKLRSELTRRLAAHPEKDRLYALSIQLFPLDQRPTALN